MKVVWKREDETRFDQFRPASRSRLKVWAEPSGQLVGWDHHLASPWAETVATIDSSTLGKEFLYEVPNTSFRHSTIASRIEIGGMRGVNSVYNVFAVESAIDELAAKLDRDPFALRMQWLLRQPQLDKIAPPPHGTEGIFVPTHTSFARMLTVLRACGDAIGWKYRPSEGRGMGIAIYNHYGTHCAVAADVELTRKATLRIRRMVAAVDMGIVVNPLGATAQIEGGLVMGLSETLRERVTFEGGKAQQSTYSDYPLVSMPDVPPIDVILVRSDAFPTGAGEVGVPGPGPALVNALFAATGDRIRSLPLLRSRPALDPMA